MEADYPAGLTEDHFDPVGHPVMDRVVTGTMTLLPALGLAWGVRSAWGRPFIKIGKSVLYPRKV